MDDLVRDFVAEAREGIEALDSQLVRFEQDPGNPELLGEVFRLIHTIKGTCGFIGLLRLQAVAHAAETVLGGFRDGTVVVTQDAVTAVLQAVDLIRSLIEHLAETGLEAAGDDDALIARLGAAAREGEAPSAAAASGPARQRLIDRVGGDATLDAAAEMLIGRLPGVASLPAALAGADLDRVQLALRDGLAAAARGDADGASIAASLRAYCAAGYSESLVLTLLLDAIEADLAALDIPVADVRELLVAAAPPAAAAATDSRTQPPEPAVSDPAQPVGEREVTAQTIRVGVDALEHLMTVASELVLIRNQLLQLLRIDPESPFAAPLHRLNQVTSELQEGVMTTRMQPISGAWAKLPRLVRDLSRDLGKKIDLALAGQDTELDRQVLELIKDPLIHMIRNAADHGLETPAERLAAGKSETGRIALSARHEGGAIVIEMSDDGRGLPAARIRAKAVSSGVITPQQAEAMSDAEARRLIFLPGFSTAAEVTAVSGRGVGMDVVRTNIEKIGGVIEADSTEGVGTQFTIRIPLTLTIVSALIVECCGERFAMPQSSVVELVSASDASAHNIEYIDGSAVLRLRDRLLPLVSLQSLLGLPQEAVRRDETCIVVARVGQFTYGVIVDRVFDTEEIVVKPVATVLRHLKVYSGATILGDGTVIMILDFKGMSPDPGASVGAARAAEDPAAASGVERQDMLVFRAGDGALRATPLAEVARIEEVNEAQIERVDGRTVIQYRGRLMPVVGHDGMAITLSAEPRVRPLLVFTRQDSSVGVLVHEIVDIIETVVTTYLAGASEGSAGSLIIAGHATELIDVDHFWRRAMGAAARPAKPAAAALTLGDMATGPLKRLLVVDDSPFSQLLLRPLLAKAGYDVCVAVDPEAALALHDAGEHFDLIMADTAVRGDEARRTALAFGQARRWNATPLLDVGVRRIGGGDLDEGAVLASVSERLEMRGAA